MSQMPDDFYAVLGVEPRRGRRRDQACLPPPRPRAAPRRQPRRPRRPRSGSSRSPSPTRCCPTPRSARRYDTFGVDGLRAGAEAGFDPFSGFAGSAFGDLFDAFFGGGGAGAAGARGASGPPRGADLEISVDLDFEEAVFGASKPITVRSPVLCTACSGTGAAPGTFPSRCHDLQRRRRGPSGPAVDPRPDGHRLAVPPLRRRGRGDHTHRATSCRGEGRVTERLEHTVNVPAGVDNGTTLRLSGLGAAGPAGRRVRRPLRAPPGPPPRASSPATARTSSACSTSR